jgi:hypothetical protein
MADEATAKVQADVQKVKEAVTPAKITPSEGNVKQWAKWTADQLRRTPDIKSFGALRLRELTERGPVSARGVWGTAREALEHEYGNVTIDDLLAEFALPQST